MKAYTYILFTFFSINCFSQLPDSLFVSNFESKSFSTFASDSSLKSQIALLVASNPNTTVETFADFYNQLISFNERHPLSKSPRRLFHTVQDSFLTKYQETAYLTETLQDSSFSCVTGSALLAFYLELNGFEYKIEEQPEHVFVSVSYKNKTYLLESTDEQFGFLKDNRVNRSQYAPDTLDDNYVFKLITSYSHLDKKGVVVKSEITLYELAGLHYYNQAVAGLNDGDFLSASQNLEKAHYLFPSQRISEMYKFCLLQLIEDRNLPMSSRTLYLNRLSQLAYPISAR